MVHTDLADMGVWCIRLANLPPEVPDRTIRDALTQYGEAKEVNEGSWSKAYRYPLSNGVRIAVTHLKNLSSHLVIAGTAHLLWPQWTRSDCLRRRKIDAPRDKLHEPSWADLVTQGRMSQQQSVKHNAAPFNQRQQTAWMPGIEHNVT
jgi:hypothetical protein